MLLFIDDDEDILLLYQMLARRLKIPALFTHNGYEALTLCYANPVKLIVSDINRGGLHGLALLERLRSDPAVAHIPLIFVSAGNDYQQRAALGYPLDADDFLAKPFDPLVLSQKILALLETCAVGC